MPSYVPKKTKSKPGWTNGIKQKHEAKEIEEKKKKVILLKSPSLNCKKSS